MTVRCALYRSQRKRRGEHMAEKVEVITIPAYSKEDFTESTVPFDFLMGFQEDPFVQQQMVQRMKEYAATVGIRSFVSLWNIYQKSLAQKGKAKELERATDFTDQPVELYCGEYTCTDAGVRYVNKLGFPVVVCQHPILVSRRYVNVDSGEEKLEVAFARAGRWKKPVICDRTMLANSQKILELAAHGVAVDSDNARELVKYITYIENRNYDKLGETQSVGRLGWIEGCGFSPYVDGLQFDGDVSFRQMFQAVQSAGTLKKWLETVRPGREHSQIVRIMLAASFASVLIEPLGCLPFFCHVWGGTEAGKTVGLMVATSVWANPAPGEYLKTFNTTNVHMEQVAGFCNSLPLCFDELQINKDRQDFDKTIYMLAEGISKGRGAKSGGIQRVYSWHNCILTTGEMPISTARSGGGAVNRIVEIDCKGERLFTDPRTTANGVRKVYGTAGKAFVDALMQDGGIEWAATVYNQYYAELSDGEVTEKQAMAGALILTADQLAEDWIFLDGLRVDKDALKKYLSTKDEVDANKRAYAWLMDFLAVNGSHFAGREDVPISEIWGEISEAEGVAYIINSVFDAKMAEAGFNPNAFKSWANGRGVLKTDGGEKRLTRQKRIKGSKVKSRCVCLELPRDEQSGEVVLAEIGNDEDPDFPFNLLDSL